VTFARLRRGVKGLALKLLRQRLRSPLYHHLIEVALAGGGFLLYFLVRGSVVGRATEAFTRGLAILHLEDTLGLLWELELQAWALSSHFLAEVWGAIYFWGHFPTILAIGLWLYVFHRHRYTLLRNALLLSGAIALIIYGLFPVAPPRLMSPLGFVDVMNLYNQPNYQAQEVQPFVNPYAAVPSLHFGWVFILGLALVWFFPRNPLAWLVGIFNPAAQVIAIMVTGHHFFLDAVAGGVVALAGLLLALLLCRWGYPFLSRYLPTELVLHLTPPPARIFPLRCAGS